jgi:hypothetical protein
MFTEASSTLKVLKGSNINARREYFNLLEKNKTKTYSNRPDWNKSTEIGNKEKKEEESYKKRKIVITPSWISPIERERIRNEKSRERKLDERLKLEEEALRRKQTPKVYTLGLKEKWTSSLLNTTNDSNDIITENVQMTKNQE